MAKKTDTIETNVPDKVIPTAKKPDNVALVKQKIEAHLLGKEKVDLQEIYNML